MEALFESVGAQIEAGDAPGATRRFFEEAVLGPGGWSLVPEPVQAAAIGNAQTFVDMLADPGWGALDDGRDRALPRPHPDHQRRHGAGLAAARRRGRSRAASRRPSR